MLFFVGVGVRVDGDVLFEYSYVFFVQINVHEGVNISVFYCWVECEACTYVFEETNASYTMREKFITRM